MKITIYETQDKRLQMHLEVIALLEFGRQDTQHNDIQYNNTHIGNNIFKRIAKHENYILKCLQSNYHATNHHTN